MFWLLRRWVRWTPAAFVGGLVFGFSPFVFVNLAGGHLMTGVLVLVPLMVACLDELLIRQRGGPPGRRRGARPPGGAPVLLEHRGSRHRGHLRHGRRARPARAYAAFEPGQLAARAPHALAWSGRRRRRWRSSCSAYPLWFASTGRRTCRAWCGPRIAPGGRDHVRQPVAPRPT